MFAGGKGRCCQVERAVVDVGMGRLTLAAEEGYIVAGVAEGSGGVGADLDPISHEPPLGVRLGGPGGGCK